MTNTLNTINAPKVLKNVMTYSVLSGGKRIRPFILSEIAKLYDVNPKVYKYPGMAIEMVHCFSLIYDDLPCMDDDDMRRGKPTVHIKFNEEIRYSLLPKPHFLTKNLSINREKKEIGLVKNFKIYISIGNFFKFNQIDIKDLVFNKGDFNISKDDFVFFKNLLNIEPNENKFFSE